MPENDTKNKQHVAYAIVDFGQCFLGRKFVYGATRYYFGQAPNEAVFDCSSFQRYIYGTVANIELEVDSRKQATQGTQIGIDELQTGDLVFFTYMDGYIYHVSMYVSIDGKERLLHTYGAKSDVLDLDLNIISKGKGGVTWSDFSKEPTDGHNWRKNVAFAIRVIGGV